MHLNHTFLTPALTALVFAGTAFAQSDDCTAPPAAALGANAYDNTAASTTAFDGGGGCSNAIGADQFFTFTAPADGSYNIDTCGTSYDTILSVHFGGDCLATCLASNDDSSCGLQSSVQVPLLTGDVVLVQVGGYLANAGPGTLNIAAAPPPPTNDDCSTPSVAVLGANAFDNTSATSTTPAGLCTPTVIGNDMFYTFVVPADDNYAFDTIGTTYDSEISVSLGADCSAVCIGSDDANGPGNDIVTVIGALTGQTYLIRVGGWQDGVNGPGGVLNISVPPPPPANDDCSTPDTTTLVGTGSFAFDSTSALTSGFDGGGAPCNNGQNGAPETDVFFEWVATADGTFIFDTIGSSYNTLLSVHAGSGCAATCLGSDDNGGGGIDALVSVDGIVMGSTYLLQVGNWTAGVAGGPGTITITEDIPILNPANGHYYRVVNTDLSWTDARTAAEASSYLGLPGHLVTIEDQAEMDFLINSLNWDRPWTGGFQDVNDPNYAEPAGGWVWTTGEPFAFTNWVAGEPNDNPVGENHIELLRGLPGSSTAEGGWNDTLDVNPTAHSYIVEYDGGGSPITILCDPASNHFQGDYVKLDGSSFGSGNGSDLNISAVDGPIDGFGFVLVSPDGSANLAIFNGVLCLGSPQGRYNPQIATNQGLPQLNSIGQFDASGILQNLFGNATSTGGAGFDVPTELPFSPAGQTIGSGDTLYFQVWYRDQLVTPGDTANFSNMIEVQF
tara:strand:- start:3917 stop:6100 length:2184 start_codon:yes stop_codon:yes gene_type:complete